MSKIDWLVAVVVLFGLVPVFAQRLGDMLEGLLGRAMSIGPNRVMTVEPNVYHAACHCGHCTVEAPHSSDCAVHNEPAYTVGVCDCAIGGRHE